MADYLWRLWNFRGWHEEGYLPLRNVSFDWKLNDIGSLQASMGLQQGLPTIRPGEHCIIVERNEQPVWAGPIWSMDYDSNSSYVQFRASEWASYLRRRRIRDTYPEPPWEWVEPDPESHTQQVAGWQLNFRGWDQLDIARQLIAVAQGGRYLPGLGWTREPTRDLHIDVNQGREFHQRPQSGVYRDRNYAAVDRKEIWEAMTQLGDVIGGFDQRLRVMYTGTANEHGDRHHPWIYWEPFYPRQGWWQERHGTVLEYREGWAGSNVTDYRWSTKADEMTNVAEAANEEAVATAEDQSAWTYYPLLEALAQKGGEGGVTSVDTLQQHADALLAANRRVMANGSFAEIRPDSVPELGPDLIGGEIRVRLTSWRHPAKPDGSPGLDQFMRIVSIGINAPSDERAESVSMELQPMPLEPWEPYPEELR